MEFDKVTQDWRDRSKEWWERLAAEHHVSISVVMAWEIRPPVRAVLSELIAQCDEDTAVVDVTHLMEHDDKAPIVSELHARDILLHAGGEVHLSTFGEQVAHELGLDRP